MLNAMLLSNIWATLSNQKPWKSDFFGNFFLFKFGKTCQSLQMFIFVSSEKTDKLNEIKLMCAGLSFSCRFKNFKITN